MSFEWPLTLVALMLVPLAIAAYLFTLRRKRTRYALRFTNLDVLAAVVATRRPWRRFVPAALVLAALALTLVGVARPSVDVAVPSENATVVLVVDVSGSMRARDVQPTRLEAAQVALNKFLDIVPAKLQVALVSFSTEPSVMTPPTHQHDLVREAVQFLFYGYGTALGDGLAAAVDVGRSALQSSDRLAEAGESPVSILLLSDGAQTEGLLTPLQAAQRARDAGMPIYAIALGTPEGVVEIPTGPYIRTVPVPPDPVTLQRIAETTGGKFYAAATAARLEEVYAELGSRVGRKQERREVTHAFLGAGALLLLVGGLLGARWLPRLP